MKIYIICKDKSVLFGSNLNLNVYDHIEKNYDDAIKFIKEHENDFYNYNIKEEEITV